ncbi:Bug family tripartite tricarboxylate transporter substrate binding protein [Falsiroseomonas tokyonensis]|uniref:Bug family tripartite tricarboxylate transporter substrate binding protein n=1 Tax=Falsiroseomonas tokyonensis TaxID=430521 RepID=A0ABV7BTU3_9PROT|nr:tripartite tricarboxylate transporter substrate binding protein [Falsiroseomonas tokyonensis]MBU8538943.1 tripartite tricarboxylate transporter substrate binding protein [Falsiroseomonas tokyonensis]
MTTTRRGLMAAALATAPILSARAQSSWPERPLRFIVPFPAGSSPDLTGRVVTAHLATALGQPVVVENRAGAGGNIGTDAVAKATDGHTIGLSINGPLSTAPALFANLPYDPVRDLKAVSLLVRGPQFLVVNKDLPVTDLAGFIAHVKANPGKLAFGSVGPGSGGHLGMIDLMAKAGGLEMLHVPYRGFPDATLDLVAGRIQAMVVTTAAVMGQVRDGSIRAIAVTSANRFHLTPQVPTLAEQGIANAESYGWQIMVAPANTPPERIARLAAEAQKGLREAAGRQRLENAGFEVMATGPEEAAAFLAEETDRWGGMIRRLGIRMDA